ncbi:MAG: Mrp/NBP35 family ATP-binding protein [Planctomycetes bacterium]|nr:Mrp/NBP35 family ATP-binding protein [Planctomycetota bacterium]
MPLTDADLQSALRTVKDPDLGKDLVTLDMVRGASMQGDRAVIDIELTTPACPMKDAIRADIERAVNEQSRIRSVTPPPVEVRFTARVRAAARQGQGGGNPLPRVKHVIAVGAGKGGVGKSTISVNLAVGLARMGARVGLLDGDIYGPSAPTMLGLDDLQGAVRGELLVPFSVHGIEAITIGKLVDPDKALIWRGPMAHGAFKQLAVQTDWGDLDYLIVDLPPGTGDVPLTLAQLLPLTGAVVVCTPQRVAQDDARRAIRMFQQLQVPVLGVVENMSAFIDEHGTVHDLFGRGGAEVMASTMGLPFLGALPVHVELRRNCDVGTPLKNWSDNAALAAALDGICQRVASQVSIESHRHSLVQPTLSVKD